ncbi:50S ribosomal protein L19-1, chloroplastic [Capsicum chinense]|nr:50S ribosomal protein L19-1, chloroplastic [Capsicum chinense]
MWRRFSSHLRSTAPSGILARFGNASKKNEVELGVSSHHSYLLNLFYIDRLDYITNARLTNTRIILTGYQTTLELLESVHYNLFETRLNVSVHSKHNRNASLSSPYMAYRSCLSQYSTMIPNLPGKFNKSGATSVDMVSEDASALATPRIKFKRLDKTAKHIMQILDKEAVEEVKVQREIPDIKPGYVIQLKLEVPENRRRVSIVKGTVIARRNAGLNTTIRLRRNLAGVGVENLFHLYSPNLKEIKVLDKNKVRRAKLYYVRDKPNALKKH